MTPNITTLRSGSHEPPPITDIRRRNFVHDKVKLLEESKGRPVGLKFQDGTKHVLLPSGQHISQEPGKSKGVSARQFKRIVKRQKRQLREAVSHA